MAHSLVAGPFFIGVVASSAGDPSWCIGEQETMVWPASMGDHSANASIHFSELSSYFPERGKLIS